MKTILFIGSIFIGLIIPMEEVLANKTASEASFNYELVCEMVETENGDTEWSCEFVQVTRSVDVTVMGSGGGGSNTQVYLMCYEHYENGMPTGETTSIRIL